MEAQNTDRYNSKASGSFMSVSTQQDKNHRQSEPLWEVYELEGRGGRRKPAFLKEEHAGRKEGKKEEGNDEEENPQRGTNSRDARVPAPITSPWKTTTISQRASSKPIFRVLTL